MCGKAQSGVCWGVLVVVLVASASAAERPSAFEYVATKCAAYTAAYAPLVDQYLSQFRGGFSLADILQTPAMYNNTRLQREFKGSLPLLYVLDGELFYDSSLPEPGAKRLKNLEFFGIPLLQQLAQLAGTLQACSISEEPVYLGESGSTTFHPHAVRPPLSSKDPQGS